MLHTFENDFLRVCVCERGAELCSVVGKKSGAEYLWQGDPAFWSGRATVLFPICGRLFGGAYTYRGRRYEMPIHGIAKSAVFRVGQKSGDRVALVFCSDEQTRRAYPFDFRFRVVYALDGATLSQRFFVENTGGDVLPFSLGGHPGFFVPFPGARGESFGDYRLEFAGARKTRAIRLSDDGFYIDEQDFSLRDGRVLDLRHDLFDRDALFLSGAGNSVRLCSQKNGRAITVRFSDMTHLGFWHTPRTEAPFVCVEPWHGTPSRDGKIDDFSEKSEMIRLPAGETYTTEISISIEE